MKRILGSLLVIVAIIGAGVLATGAYFQTTDTANNYTFTTSSPGLLFGFCPGGTNVACDQSNATLTTYSFSTPSQTGPDLAGVGCLVVKNSGPYLLHLTANEVVGGASPDGMQDAFRVESQLTNSNCADPSGLAEVYSWQSARQAQADGNVVVTDLAPGAVIYLLQRNRWDSTGNQNGLENGTIVLNTSLTGTTN